MGKKIRIQTGSRQMDAAVAYIEKKIDQITPSIYAAFTIALKEDGWENEDIIGLFAKTQEIWARSLEDNRNIIQQCSDEWDIDVRAGKAE